MNRRNAIIIISILAFIMVVGGISYSYFVYNKNVGNVTLDTGDISINLSGVSANRTITNAMPKKDSEGKTSSDYFDWTVNATVETERIYYEVYLIPESGNTLNTNYLKTYLTDQNNNEIKGVAIYNDLAPSEVENGKVLYRGIVEIDNSGSRTETKDFRLRLWIDEKYQEASSKTYSFDIYLYAKNVSSDFKISTGSDLLREAITNKLADSNCSHINYEEDNISYLSGTSSCIDMNYVWYSGKLWRITEIYPDGSMKMTTDDNITSIQWGENAEYNHSWIYQWLNEDFYETLHNIDYIVKSSTWNYTTTTNNKIKLETLSPQKTLVAKVGLLNTYEYYNTFRCANSDECTNGGALYGYLNNGYYNWLLNPYDEGHINTVYNSMSFSNNMMTSTLAVRPSIVLKSDVEFTGNGSKSNPYKIIGDKKTANVNDKINTRISGEYLRFNNELYRIVEANEKSTKIIKVDYLKSNDTVLNKQFASSSYYGKSSNTKTDDYWDYYLNNTWVNSLPTSLKNMLVDDTYYLGPIGDASSYKYTICKDANLNNVTVKNCSKWTSDDADKTFTGKVGLSRCGEMFATQVNDVLASNYWTITPYNSSNVRYLYTTGQLRGERYSNLFAVHPTLSLKSTVKITSGNGYINSPYEISE